MALRGYCDSAGLELMRVSEFGNQPFCVWKLRGKPPGTRKGGLHCGTDGWESLQKGPKATSIWCQRSQ